MKGNSSGGIHYIRALKSAVGHPSMTQCWAHRVPRHLCPMYTFKSSRNPFPPALSGQGFSVLTSIWQGPARSSCPCGSGGSAWRGARRLTSSGVRSVLAAEGKVLLLTLCWVASFLRIDHHGNPAPFPLRWLVGGAHCHC